MILINFRLCNLCFLIYCLIALISPCRVMAQIPVFTITTTSQVIFPANGSAVIISKPGGGDITGQYTSAFYQGTPADTYQWSYNAGLYWMPGSGTQLVLVNSDVKQIFIYQGENSFSPAPITHTWDDSGWYQQWGNGLTLDMMAAAQSQVSGNDSGTSPTSISGSVSYFKAVL